MLIINRTLLYIASDFSDFSDNFYDCTNFKDLKSENQ